MGKPSPLRILAGMNEGTFDGVFCHQRARPPRAGKCERDSSRALNFARGSFASFLAPSRKEGISFSLLRFILDKYDSFYTFSTVI